MTTPNEAIYQQEQRGHPNAVMQTSLTNQETELCFKKEHMTRSYFLIEFTVSSTDICVFVTTVVFFGVLMTLFKLCVIRSSYVRMCASAWSPDSVPACFKPQAALLLRGLKVSEDCGSTLRHRLAVASPSVLSQVHSQGSHCQLPSRQG